MSCHVLQHRKTGENKNKNHRGSKIPVYQLVLLGNSKHPILHTHSVSSGLVGYRERGACKGDTTLPTPTQVCCHRQAGKRIVSSFFPFTVNKQCYHHTLESLIAVTRVGWKLVCKKKCHTLARQCCDNGTYWVWVSQLWSPNMNRCTPPKNYAQAFVSFSYCPVPRHSFSFSLMLRNTV